MTQRNVSLAADIDIIWWLHDAEKVARWQRQTLDNQNLFPQDGQPWSPAAWRQWCTIMVGALAAHQAPLTAALAQAAARVWPLAIGWHWGAMTLHDRPAWMPPAPRGSTRLPSTAEIALGQPWGPSLDALAAVAVAAAFHPPDPATSLRLAPLAWLFPHANMGLAKGTVNTAHPGLVVAALWTWMRTGVPHPAWTVPPPTSPALTRVITRFIDALPDLSTPSFMRLGAMPAEAWRWMAQQAPDAALRCGRRWLRQWLAAGDPIAMIRARGVDEAQGGIQVALAAALQCASPRDQAAAMDSLIAAAGWHPRQPPVSVLPAWPPMRHWLDAVLPGVPSSRVDRLWEGLVAHYHRDSSSVPGFLARELPLPSAWGEWLDPVWAQAIAASRSADTHHEMARPSPTHNPQ